MPVLGDVLRYTVTPLIVLLLLPVTLGAIFAPCPVPEQFKRRFPRLMMLRPWQLRARLADGATMLQSAAALGRGYTELRTPTLIVAGDSDRVVADWHSTKLSKHISESELHILPGVGHMVHHSPPIA